MPPAPPAAATSPLPHSAAAGKDRKAGAGGAQHRTAYFQCQNYKKLSSKALRVDIILAAVALPFCSGAILSRATRDEFTMRAWASPHTVTK